MNTAPVLPDNVVPDPIYNAPLLPELDVPVLSTKIPLTPAAPAFDVWSSNAPLLAAVPKPLVMDTRPPVADDDVPADRMTSPPEPLLPDPTSRETEPPRPTLDVPVPMIIDPLLPDKDKPDPIKIEPLTPTLAAPVLSTTIPLTPEVPAFAVCKSNAPLLVVVPTPLVIDTRPPVADDDAPEDRIISPPDPLLPDPTVK
jgi:hypothetical protein